MKHGSDTRLRIALCGHDGEHDALQAEGWTVKTWAKSGGYQGKDERERIWFSPGCVEPVKEMELFDLDALGVEGRYEPPMKTMNTDVGHGKERGAA